MTGGTAGCLRVGVFAPLRGWFDYLPPPGQAASGALIGCRVRVPFGRGQRFGVITASGVHSPLSVRQLKAVTEIIDHAPVIDDALLGLALWAIEYYHAAPGDVLEALLPGELRRGAACRPTQPPRWILSPAGADACAGGRGPRQQELLALAARPEGVAREEVLARGLSRLLTRCLASGWLSAGALPEPLAAAIPREDVRFLTPNPAQAAVLAALREPAAGYRADLLHGITGSGKTEIYLQRARDVLADGRQVLVLVPEIGLTGQIVHRFSERFGEAVAVMHSELGDRTRAVAWQRCRSGAVRVLLGTRSAVWMPLPDLGLVVVDEEHDPSYRQQEGFRYSARDVAVVRARRAGVPILLGSATPSLESLANCARGKYRYHELKVRAGDAQLPRLRIVDIRGHVLHAGLGEVLCAAIRARAGRGEQSLLFLNRRGYAPTVLCHRCGWIASCARCDARLVLHRHDQSLRCHHCGTERPVNFAFPGHTCGAHGEYVNLGVGTEQIESALPALFPGLRIARIDRDSTAGRGRLAQALESVRAGDVDILVGTQMIAKGHDFTKVTLVGVIDGDSGLLASDFRAEERFAQLITQVAGRAGRADRQGEVLIQTHRPDHPIFTYLCRDDYRGFAEAALSERQAAGLPPHTALVLLRAEATRQALPMAFLQALAASLRGQLPIGVELGGPVPALMERRIGKYRANLMLTSADRAALAWGTSQLLAAIEASPDARRVHWTLDVDAQDVT